MSYVPAVWHPMVVTDPGGDDYFQPDMRAGGLRERVRERAARTASAPPVGCPPTRSTCPRPHEVLARAFYTAFTTPPELRDGPWLHESLWHSIHIIFWGFALSSVIGVPLGILCGTYTAIARLNEPFIEFFRYLPGARPSVRSRRDPGHR